MSRDPSLFELVRHPIEVRTLGVRRVRDLTPRMRRVTLAGPALAGFASLAPEDHVKVFFPRPGEREPALPAFGPLGVPLPSSGPRPIGRDYTPRRYDAAAGELDIDFYLHGHGVASAWAAQAREGQTLGVAGPRGSFVLSRAFDVHVFVGDETALPEMARRIEELPARTRVFAVGLVDGPDEEQPWPETRADVGRGGRSGRVPTEVKLHARWVHRFSPGADAGEALVDAVRSLALPAGADAFAWVAGEASEVRRVYRLLVRELGFPVGRVHTSGHWKRGVVAHDHHEPVPLDDASATSATSATSAVGASREANDR